MADSPRARRRPRPSASFLRFLLRRAAALVLLAIGITLVVFVLTQLVPSNAVATNLGEQAAADPAAVAAFKAHYVLGEILEKQGDKAGAAAEYRAALELAKDYSEAKQALARVQR